MLIEQEFDKHFPINPLRLDHPFYLLERIKYVNRFEIKLTK